MDISEKVNYIAPVAVEIETGGQVALCASPQPGGNENVIFENWEI